MSLLVTMLISITFSLCPVDPGFVLFVLLGDVSGPEFHLAGPDGAIQVRTDGDHPAQSEGIQAVGTRVDVVPHFSKMD